MRLKTEEQCNNETEKKKSNQLQKNSIIIVSKIDEQCKNEILKPHQIKHKKIIITKNTNKKWSIHAKKKPKPEKLRK